MTEFFSMNGYGVFVWSAFGITLLILVGNVIAARKRYADACQVVRLRQMAQGSDSP